MTTIVDGELRVQATSTSSVLRWMGSKKRIAAEVISSFPELGENAVYFEPFLGGGSVFFSYAPSHAILGDANGALINAWRWIGTDARELWRAVSAIEVTAESYYAIRATPEEPLSFNAAVQFVYLNRYCFNGIYRTNRRHEFNVPFGRNTGGLPTLDAFLACSDRLETASLLSGDFEETTRSAVAGDVVYLDPPWQSSRATHGEYGYTSHSVVTPERILEVASALHSDGIYVFVSLPKDVAHLFSNWPTRNLNVNYKVGSKQSSRSKQTELLVAFEPSGKAGV